MFFSEGLNSEFETAMVTEPSVFEPLKFYCIVHTKMALIGTSPLLPDILVLSKMEFYQSNFLLTVLKNMSFHGLKNVLILSSNDLSISGCLRPFPFDMQPCSPVRLIQ